MTRKYFTTKLSSLDRQKILSVLGFNEFRFLLLEISGDTVLRASETIGNKRSALLEPITLQDAKIFVEGYHYPVLLLQYAQGSHQLPVRTVNESISLWEEICPFPLSVFCRHFDGLDPNPKMEPAEVRNSFKGLFETLQRLEQRMAETELSIVWLHSQTEEFALLFHYVRKRRLNVGTSDVLAQVTMEYEAGTLDAEKLLETFGTQTSFFNVDLTDPLSETNPATKLTQAIEKAITTPLQAMIGGVDRGARPTFVDSTPSL